jgi:hypothetical protein
MDSNLWRIAVVLPLRYREIAHSGLEVRLSLAGHDKGKPVERRGRKAEGLNPAGGKKAEVKR